MNATPPKVRCLRCWQSPEACICSAIVTTTSPLRILILQHPQESRNPKSTSRLLAISIKGSVHKVGLSWRSLSAALGVDTAPRNWAVLYLGPRKDSAAFKANESIRLTDRKGLTVAETDLEGIIVLDGNWKQAKTLWWRNAWLTRIKRVILNPNRNSAYGELRRQPRKNCLSTLESTAACLAELTGQKAIETILLSNQEKLLERVLEPNPKSFLLGAVKMT
ncbi:MAG: DTW domain-containing protein [Deltaproteobacteria bacterium]|nr:DTW domain-containing protein [Deltaproteobacteria bacterium]